MSCGTPHETDCSEILDEVYMYLDGETDEDQRRLIRQHLDECAPCLREYGLEQAVKALVARSCGGDAPPDGLRSRVLTRVREVRLEITRTEYRAE